MNELDVPFSLLSVSEMSIVLDLQNRFEFAWKNTFHGEPNPSIEALLQEVSSDWNDDRLTQITLHHLLMLDLEYRAERDEALDIKNYLQRFPSHPYVVQTCFNNYRLSKRSLEIVGPLAEGGLGIVEVAWDRGLNRKVAYKRLKSNQAGNLGVQARFRREAEVTARLRHPSIISIYSFNEDADGECSYVMPLIDGKPLDEVIADFHDRQKSKSTYSSYLVGIRGLLRHFVDACQAIAYAHSQGCIHRDIKPQNVMVGPFGETLVVDWGLAKFLGDEEVSTSQGDGASRTKVDTISDRVSVTRTGDVFGTPMFMSPEQAAGKGSAVGTSSDVYSLGATLYMLLTGVGPFEGSDSNTLLSDIIQGDISKPRDIQKLVPRALEAICMKCLASHPEDRYHKVEDLIEDIENWFANESVSAYREPWPESISRWTRRHPITIAILVAIAGITLLGSAITSSIMSIKNKELYLANSEAQAKRKVAEERLTDLVTTTDILSNILSDTSDVSFEEKEQVPLKDRLLSRIRSAAKSLGKRPTLDPVVFAKLQVSFGGMLMDLGEDEEAIGLFRNAFATYEEKLGENSEGSLQAKYNLAMAYKKTQNIEDAIATFEDLIDRNSWSNQPSNEMLAKSLLNLAIVYADRGKLGSANETIQRAEEVVRSIKDKHFDNMLKTAQLLIAERTGPVGLVISRYEELLQERVLYYGEEHPYTCNTMYALGVLYGSVNRWEEEVPVMERCLDIRIRVLGREHKETLDTEANLAFAKHKTRKYEDAISKLQSLLEISKRLYGTSPVPVHTQLYLARAKLDVGDIPESLELLQDCLMQAEKIWKKEEPKFLLILRDLVFTLVASNRIEQATPYAEECVKLHLDVLGDNCTETASAMSYLGLCYLRSGRVDEAIPLLQDCLRIRREVVGENQFYTLDAINTLASAYSGAGRLPDAIAILENALSSSSECDPSLDTIRLALQTNLASNQGEQGDWENAVITLSSCYDRAKVTWGENRYNTAEICRHLAFAHEKLNHLDESIRFYSEALERLEKAVGDENLATINARYHLFFYLFGANRLELASEVGAKIMESCQTDTNSEEYLTVMHRMGEIHKRLDRVEEAERYFRECLARRLRLIPDDWRTFNTMSWLGAVVADENQKDEARTLLVDGTQGMLDRFQAIPENARANLHDAFQRIADIFEAWGEKDEAEKWRTKLEGL